MRDLRSISMTHNTHLPPPTRSPFHSATHTHTHALQTADATLQVHTIWCQSGNTSFAQVTVSNHLPRAKKKWIPTNLHNVFCFPFPPVPKEKGGGLSGRTQGPGVKGPGDAGAPVPPTTEAPLLGLAGSCLPPLRHPTADSPQVVTGALFSVNSLIY